MVVMKIRLFNDIDYDAFVQIKIILQTNRSV
jgi:hypothetical protein